MKVTAEQVLALEARHVLKVYNRAPVVFVQGSGSRLVDVDGREYIDWLSGIGVASLGHAHPGLAAALAAQTRELAHTSNLFFHPLQGQVAERLTRLSGLDRVFFCNSGSEAVETCLKFARRYWHARGERNRTGYVALERSFHGRTFGALSVTSGAAYRDPFQPLLPDVTFAPPGDPAALQRAVTRNTAAVIVEPVQGEGGVVPLTAAAAEVVDAACRETGALLIADEVQCGLGRTGRAFAAPAHGLRPDLMALGKALGGGMPIGAALLSARIAQEVQMGDHGSTYGGNLLACRAALVFLDALETGLIDRVGAAGARLAAGLGHLSETRTAVGALRGAGLMLGIEVPAHVAGRVVPAALAHGLIVNRTAGTVIRLLPPLTIGDADIDEGLARFGAAVDMAVAEAS